MKTTKLIFLVCLITLISFTTASINFLQDGTEDVFEVKVRKYNRAELEKIALGCETYSRNKQTIPLLGGLHDYIFTLTDEDVIKVIYDYTNQYPELKDIPTLEKIGNIQQRPATSTFEEKLKTLSRYELEQWALSGESYKRKKDKKENLIGGLEDYLTTITNDQVIAIIINFAKEFPELKENNLYESLVKGKQITSDDLNTVLKKKNHEELVHIAISLDEYEKTKSSIIRIGGIHDYAYTLKDKELIDFIVNFSKKWPEVLTEGFIDGLLRGKNNLIHSIIGGFEDYAFRLERPDLISCALACENYDREKRNIHVLGGLHDYVNSLTNENILKIVIGYVHQYPEFRKPGFVEGLARIPQGGFDSFLRQKTQVQLIDYCIAIEDYDNDKRHINQKGFKNYVYTLNYEQLIAYIKNKAEYYPGIRSSGFIQEILKEYKKNHDN